VSLGALSGTKGTFEFEECSYHVTPGPGRLQMETHGQQAGSTGIKWASQIKLVQVEPSKTK